MSWRARLHRYLLAVIDGRATGPPAWVLRAVLACGVPVYWLGLQWSRAATRARRVSCPVVSIGNITVGGTGKTPVVAWLAQRLRQAGWRPAILTRGYARAIGSTGLVDTNIASPAAGYGDEPVWLARQLPGVPVLVGADRCVNAVDAVRRHQADCILLDDGFQHWALARDLDIVLLDGDRPFGSGALLPLGTLREPVGALRRAQLLLVRQREGAADTTEALRRRLHQRRITAPVIPFRYRAAEVHEPSTGQTRPPEAVRGARVRLLSSIAQPASFESLARALGVEVEQHLAYPDHHAYRVTDARHWAASGQRTPLLTTEKDWMRLESLAGRGLIGPPVWVLRIAVELVHPHDEALIHDRLARLRRG